MKTVWLLQHVHDFDNGHDDIKLIGVYSCEKDAIDAQIQVADQPGFRETPEGFCISEHRLGHSSWLEGYVTIYPGEE
jgi:hypothetical protein